MLHFAVPLPSITLIALRILKITALILLTVKKVTVKWTVLLQRNKSTLLSRAEA